MHERFPQQISRQSLYRSSRSLTALNLTGLAVSCPHHNKPHQETRSNHQSTYADAAYDNTRNYGQEHRAKVKGPKGNGTKRRRQQEVVQSLQPLSPLLGQTAQSSNQSWNRGLSRRCGWGSGAVGVFASDATAASLQVTARLPPHVLLPPPQSTSANFSRLSFEGKKFQIEERFSNKFSFNAEKWNNLESRQDRKRKRGRQQRRQGQTGPWTRPLK